MLSLLNLAVFSALKNFLSKQLCKLNTLDWLIEMFAFDTLSLAYSFINFVDIDLRLGKFLKDLLTSSRTSNRKSQKWKFVIFDQVHIVICRICYTIFFCASLLNVMEYNFNLLGRTVVYNFAEWRVDIVFWSELFLQSRWHIQHIVSSVRRVHSVQVCFEFQWWNYKIFT